VYVVDDDVNNCEGITMAMEKMALKMRYAVTSEIALNELTAGPCDLIILDMDLSGMNGFRLFTLVRAIGHHEKTPVIFLSEMTGNKARVAEPRGNAHAFVSKPCDLNTLGLISLCMILKARLAALGTAPASGDESSA
jgi:DNA-binding response OmpR family regulator